MENTPLNMPTQKSVGHNSHAASINDFNLQVRQQPWYQDWFKQQGLDQNHVHLSQGQRHDLQNLILQRGGVPKDAFNDMKIDPAGNLNTEHGFASQPTWLKALEIAAAGGAAAYFAPAAGALMGGGGGTTGAAAVPTLGSTTIGTGLGVAPSIAGASTIGTAGLTGASTAALGGTGASLAGSSIPMIAGQHAVTTGMAGAAPSLTGATTLANGATVGSNLSKSLMQRAMNPDNLNDIGQSLGSMAEAEANNRINKGNQTQGYDRLMLDAQGDRRTQESDALRKLAQTSYIGSGGSQFKPPTISLGGAQRTAPDLGYGPKPVSDAQKSAASTLQDQLLARMQPGGSYTPQPLSGYADRGKMEKLGSYGGMVTTGLSLASKFL